jgi:hypothetical protein
VPVNLAPPRKIAPRARTPLLAGKIHWIRILLGITVAVAGTLCAELLFEKVIELSAGKLETTSRLQDQLITWEIKALALILGGILAGVNAPNGLKQGLFVGLASGIVLMTLQAPLAERWMEVALFTTVSTFTLCLAGGWFGGTLFPPVIKIARRSAFT